jgi:nicotinamide phosphoribosyltransferase
MKIEPYLQTDFYKISHVQFFDKDCELIYSNFTPRKSLSANNDVVFFGLQYLIKEYLINQWNEGFFNRPKDEVIGHYKNFTEKTVGAAPWQHFAELHDIGYLPLVIKAVPEGTVIKTGTPAITLYNTDKRCFWLTNYLESIISCELWKACTSATTSRLLKKVCEKFADETCDNHNHIMFQNHDFSFRGMSGLQDAAISGAGHLLSSYGTDTIPAIRFLENYYGADINKELVGCSVPASEHSCSTVKGPEGEFDFIKRAITKEYPNGIVSIVSDSYDYFKVIKEYSLNLKEEILNRGPLNGIHPKVVFRPDSGDMVEIL